MIKKIVLNLLLFYKTFISVLIKFLFAGGCRYEPTCSEYAHQAIDKFGLAKGTILSVKRLMRCHPKARLYFDPVPDKFSN